MTLLITGGAGYIGSHMAWLCYDRKIPFVVLDDLSSGFVENLPPNCVFVVGNIADEALLSDMIERYRIEAIMHFAAKIVVSESTTHPLTYYNNNTAKACMLLDCAIRHGVRHFVFSSTAAVYGEAHDGFIVESAPKNPTSPYGRSKLMIEHMLEDAHQAHGLNYAVLRYFNVAGADPAGRSGQSGFHATHLVKLACQTALGMRPEMQIFGTDYPTPDGTCIRDYIHVTDLVGAHAAALHYLQQGGKKLIANCGYGKGFSVLDVIKAVKQVSGIDFSVRLTQRRAGDPASLVADGSVARTRLGWAPRFDHLETIIRHALDWEKASTRHQ